MYIHMYSCLYTYTYRCVPHMCHYTETNYLSHTSHQPAKPAQPSHAAKQQPPRHPATQPPATQPLPHGLKNWFEDWSNTPRINLQSSIFKPHNLNVFNLALTFFKLCFRCVIIYRYAHIHTPTNWYPPTHTRNICKWPLSTYMLTNTPLPHGLKNWFEDWSRCHKNVL